MAIVPSVELLAKLRSWRLANVVAPIERNAVGDEPVYIGGTLGAWWFLTPDGRVLEVPEFHDGAAVAREMHGDKATWIIAEGAHLSGVPELLELLPPAPSGATACSSCKGTHYIGDRPVACYDCHGRGWRAA